MDKNTVLKKISSREMIGAAIWIIISMLQISLGILLLEEEEIFGVIIVVGIWNLINGIIRTVQAGKIMKRTDVVEKYEKSLVSMIIFLILNIIIGGVIGVIGSIYDLITRNYVVINEDIIK